MAKMSIEFEGFDTVLHRLKKLEGDTKKITEDVLRKTHEIVTAKAEKAMGASFLPAGGQYSTGKTLPSLKRNASIEWNGTIGSVPVGFDIANGGLVSIFLMHGTPRMKPDRELYNAFYSNSTKKEVMAAQEEIFYDAIRRLEG